MGLGIVSLPKQQILLHLSSGHKTSILHLKSLFGASQGFFLSIHPSFSGQNPHSALQTYPLSPFISQ